MATERREALTLFYSYDRQDEKLRDELEKETQTFIGSGSLEKDSPV